MKMIDSHVTIQSLGLQELEVLAAAGVEALVADAAGGMDYATSAPAAMNFFEQTLVGETKRASDYSIEVYVLVGVKMTAIPADYQAILDVLPEYLKRQRVVGLGEIGMEPRSSTCPDLSIQEEILRAELKMAKQYDKAVLLHLPASERTSWVERYVKLIDESGLDRSRAIITHSDASTTKTIIEAQCVAGLSVLPMRRMTAEDAARIVGENDINRILVTSDNNNRHSCDPISVPRVAVQMRRLGMNEEDIERVLFHNPRRILNLAI
jgi:predicted metal-dependent TIM-barrel fold hydrolase